MSTTSTNLKRFKITGESSAMQSLASWIHTVAPLPDHVLLTGERGTGKELTANAIHKLSQNRGGDLITIDCAALPHATHEATLFGYERGAFTGAVNRRIGFIELANGGSLFLDEISTLPLDMQYRFLRFLEAGTVTRIGSAKPQKIRTRVIVASNRDLIHEVRENRFLPDLYDRLNVFQTMIPPLRERGEDILLLLQTFMGKQFEQLNDDAKDYLLHYPFPGNVRELRHLSRRLSVFYPQQTVSSQDVQEQLGYASTAIMDEFEIQRFH